MQGSQKSAEKKTIMDYLPQHEKVKVRKLAQRLAEQTSEKQKYKKLYTQMCQKYDQLDKKYHELEEYSSDLKSQIATSKLAINKAKQAYIASRSAKKIKLESFNAEQDGEDQPRNLQNLKQTWMKIPKPSHKPLDNSRDQYENENNQSNSNYNFRATQRILPSVPLPLKNQNSALLKSGKKLSQQADLHGTSKKQQIMNLRKEIESLTEQMKKKQALSLPFNEKIKKCEEIKNRYLGSKQKRKRKKSSSSSGDEGSLEQRAKKSQQSKYTNNKGQSSIPYIPDDEQLEVIEAENLKEVKGTKENRKYDYRQQKFVSERSEGLNRKRGVNEEGDGQTKSKYMETGKGVKVRKQGRRNEPQMKFDESLSAIIDQLNFGN